MHSFHWSKTKPTPHSQRHTKGKTPSDFTPLNLGILAFILIGSAVVRLYALGRPMLLHDETLVVDTALRSVGYILERSLHTDAHPPFYYLLYKVIEWYSRSEFILRLLSALCGITSVWLLFVLCRKYLSKSIGIVASALLAVDLVHVAISRVVRPHAIVIMLGIVCAYRLLRFLESPSRKNIILMWLPNLAVSLWHFNGVLVIGSQLAVIAALGLTRRIPLRTALVSLAINGACLLVPAFFLVARLGQFPGVDVGNSITMLWTFNRTLENVFEIVSFMAFTWCGIAAVFFMALGFMTLLKSNTTMAVLLGPIAFLPLIVLIMMRYGIIYQAQHIAFIAPFLFIFVAVGLLQTRIHSGIIAICIIFIGGYYILFQQSSTLYDINSGLINHNLCQKPIHAALPTRLSAIDIVGFYPNSRIDAVNWEYTKSGTGDLRHFSITEDDRFVNFYLVRYPDYTQDDGRKMFGIEQAGFHPLSKEQTCCELNVTSYRIDRTPNLSFDTLPAAFMLKATPEDFFRHVYSAQDLMPVFSPLSNTLHPASYDSPATFSFHFVNTREQFVPAIDIQVNMEDKWKENTFTMAYSFDNEPPIPGLDFTNMVYQGDVTMHLGRTRQFKTLDLYFKMSCSSTMPSFYNNPDTTVFRSLFLVMQHTDPLFDSALPVRIFGLDRLESNGTQQFRWSCGPETTLQFHTQQPQHLQLDLDGRSLIVGQTVTLLLNGRNVTEHALPLGQHYARFTTDFDAPAGDNVLTLRYAFWNHGNHGPAGETFEAGDPRLLAASYTQFSLHPAQPRN